MSKNQAPVKDAAPRQVPAKIAIFAGVAVGMTILDQVTKIWVRNNLEERTDRIVVVEDFFNIVHAENPGAAFGFLNDSPYRMWVFGIFTIIALVVLFRMFLELPDDDRFQNIALGMIVSGAVGNAIDRVLYQSVTDMLDMYVVHETLAPWLRERFGTTHWPTYNVADVAIVVGLIMFGIHALFLEQDADEVEAAPPEKPLNEDAPPPAADQQATTDEDAEPDTDEQPAIEDDSEEDTDEVEPATPEAAADMTEYDTADLDGGSTEMLEPVRLDDFEEQKTEALEPVAAAPRPTRNLADPGKGEG